MLAFRVSRIVASVIHRAIFLLIADLLAGPKWFLVNNLTSLIDVLFGADHGYLTRYQDVRLTLTGFGFIFAWWMVHFLSTRQLWLNGVAAELFMLVQVLGYLSNYAFTTNNAYVPIIIAVVLYVLLGYYKLYLSQIRQLDTEQSIYRFTQLQSPFVPGRALQLIQITPFLYTIMIKLRPLMDEGTYVRVKYTLGMADALVYVGINMDISLVILSRLMGTFRTAVREFSLDNFGWMLRVNITGSHTLMIRDLGWRFVPSDQLHLSWFIYWIAKIVLVSVTWGHLDFRSRDPYLVFLAQELSGSFVAATASVYFLCLLTGSVLAFGGTLLTCSGDTIPRIQQIRWNCIPWRVNPLMHAQVTLNAVVFGHIPLCGKMIQNVGRASRRTCGCSVPQWLRAIGGITAMIGYLTYSYFVTQHLNINAPSVSRCFADAITKTSTIWFIYNILIAVMEVTTTCVFQGLDSSCSRQNMEKGSVMFRTTMTGMLAISLTAMNLLALNRSISSFNESCGYKDIAHNCLQIAARIAFVVIALRKQHGDELLSRLRNTASLTYQKSHVDVIQSQGLKCDPCGLCYEKSKSSKFLRLPDCGHTFHAECFEPWPSFGHRCPVCRAIFSRPEIETVYSGTL